MGKKSVEVCANPQPATRTSPGAQTDRRQTESQNQHRNRQTDHQGHVRVAVWGGWEETRST